ncbi:MAG: transporter [Kiritimatiellae bacterium]|nr:transporter [Kiritimatiellia bacterium]
MKKLFAIVLIAAVAGLCQAEPMRPLLVKENKFPDAGQLEAGAVFKYSEYDEEDTTVVFVDGLPVINQAGSREEMSAAPYLRYGLLENLAVVGTVPYRDIDNEFGDDASGMGDASLGFEIKVFEDIFDYPYVIPHMDVIFDTGDEDDGLGRGYSSVLLGCSVGTVVADIYHWIADARYEIRNDEENVFSGALAFIWDVSDELSVLAEGYVSDEEMPPDNDHPAFGQAGMCYKASEDLLISIYGGAGKNTGEDMVGTLKVSYSF